MLGGRLRLSRVALRDRLGLLVERDRAAASPSFSSPGRNGLLGRGERRRRGLGHLEPDHGRSVCRCWSFAAIACIRSPHPDRSRCRPRRSALADRLTLGFVLRDLVRRRAAVAVRLTSGRHLTGTIDRAGPIRAWISPSTNPVRRGERDRMFGLHRCRSPRCGVAQTQACRRLTRQRDSRPPVGNAPQSGRRTDGAPQLEEARAAGRRRIAVLTVLDLGVEVSRDARLVDPPARREPTRMPRNCPSVTRSAPASSARLPGSLRPGPGPAGARQRSGSACPYGRGTEDERRDRPGWRRGDVRTVTTMVGMTAAAPCAPRPSPHALEDARFFLGIASSSPRRGRPRVVSAARETPCSPRRTPSCPVRPSRAATSKSSRSRSTRSATRTSRPTRTRRRNGRDADDHRE